jgi:hypothetical protein
MDTPNPGSIFRRLPLTPDQQREVEHYIHLRQRAGAAWDTPELQAMVGDMLDPPELADEDGAMLRASMASERTVALGEEPAEGELPR